MDIMEGSNLDSGESTSNEEATSSEQEAINANNINGSEVRNVISVYSDTVTPSNDEVCRDGKKSPAIEEALSGQILAFRTSISEKYPLHHTGELFKAHQLIKQSSLDANSTALKYFAVSLEDVNNSTDCNIFLQNGDVFNNIIFLFGYTHVQCPDKVRLCFVERKWFEELLRSGKKTVEFDSDCPFTRAVRDYSYAEFTADSALYCDFGGELVGEAKRLLIATMKTILTVPDMFNFCEDLEPYKPTSTPVQVIEGREAVVPEVVIIVDEEATIDEEAIDDGVESSASCFTKEKKTQQRVNKAAQMLKITSHSFINELNSLSGTRQRSSRNHTSGSSSDGGIPQKSNAGSFTTPRSKAPYNVKNESKASTSKRKASPPMKKPIAAKIKAQPNKIPVVKAPVVPAASAEIDRLQSMVTNMAGQLKQMQETSKQTSLLQQAELAQSKQVAREAVAIALAAQEKAQLQQFNQKRAKKQEVYVEEDEEVEEDDEEEELAPPPPKTRSRAPVTVKKADIKGTRGEAACVVKNSKATRYAGARPQHPEGQPENTPSAQGYADYMSMCNRGIAEPAHHVQPHDFRYDTHQSLYQHHPAYYSQQHLSSAAVVPGYNNGRKVSKTAAMAFFALLASNEDD